VSVRVQRNNLAKLLRWLISLLISGLAIWLVLRQVELSQFISNLPKINFSTFIFASVVFLLSYLFRVYCWLVLLKYETTYKDAFFAMGVGYLLNNVLPFRLGEFGRAILLGKRTKLSTLEVLSSVVVERIFDIFLAASFMLSMLPRIVNAEFDQGFVFILAALSTAVIVILYMAARFRQVINQWMLAWGERSEFVKIRVAPRSTQILEGLSILTNPKYFALAFGSLTISWLIAFGQNLITFRSLSPQAPFWWMIFTLSAGAFGNALPSAPAGIGVFEGVMVAAFAVLGVDPEVALTQAVVVHFISFFYTSIFGFIGLHLQGEAFVSLYNKVMSRAT
jgi:uncharacterized protein (TIRG00374 family)